MWRVALVKQPVLLMKHCQSLFKTGEKARGSMGQGTCLGLASVEERKAGRKWSREQYCGVGFDGRAQKVNSIKAVLSTICVRSMGRWGNGEKTRSNITDCCHLCTLGGHQNCEMLLPVHCYHKKLLYFWKVLKILKINIVEAHSLLDFLVFLRNIMAYSWWMHY